MNAIKELKLDDVLDDLRTRAMQRIDELIREGRNLPERPPPQALPPAGGAPGEGGKSKGR